MEKWSYFLLGIAAALLIFFIYKFISNKSENINLMEGFKSKEEKAAAIGNWWKKGGGSYNDFRREVPGSVDVVDFFDSKNNNSKDIDKIASVLI